MRGLRLRPLGLNRGGSRGRRIDRSGPIRWLRGWRRAVIPLRRWLGNWRRGVSRSDRLRTVSLLRHNRRLRVIARGRSLSGNLLAIRLPDDIGLLHRLINRLLLRAL